jgi:patatin-like phospholipase/acyl hydrolase
VKKLTILTIDGGGIRGLIPLRILQRIEKITGKKIAHMFNMYAGASTGALIVLGLNTSKFGYEPSYKLSDIEKIYTEDIENIFPKQWFPNIRRLLGPEFDSKDLSKVINKYLSGYSMKNLMHPVIIPTFDLNRYRPFFFKSRYHYRDASYDPSLVDVAMAAISAPTYFKPHEFNLYGRDVKCIDGGLFMNNPSLAPIFDLSKHTKDYKVEDFNKLDISLLSLGTGTAPGIEYENAHKWGIAKWIRPAIRITGRANEITTDYGVADLLPYKNYLRVDPIVDKSISMSDSSDKAIKYLTEVTEKYFESKEFEDLLEFIDRNIQRL